MNRYWFLLVFLIFACDRPAATFDKQLVETEVREMLENYHQDIHLEGLMAEFKYLDSSKDFFWIPPGYNVPLTYDSVRSVLEQTAQAIREAEFHWDTLKIIPLSAEVATYHGIVTGRILDTTGTTTLSTILESGTLIRRNESWKLLSGQSVLINK